LRLEYLLQSYLLPSFRSLIKEQKQIFINFWIKHANPWSVWWHHKILPNILNGISSVEMVLLKEGDLVEHLLDLCDLLKIRRIEI
jgi:hypothetical protein